MDWLGLNVFADPPADVQLLIDCSHNLFLVALAYGVACAACFATLDIADRVIQVDALKSRRLWKALGALCLAGGVWAMHFISMLAFQAPLKIAYDLSITLISLLIVLITALVAMRALTIPELTLKRCLISAVVMGIGISVMHYLGMSAMRSTATQYYEPRMFALSILVAVLSSIALLTLSRHLRQYSGMFHQMFRYAVSLLLGAGLLTMHLMGMKALQLVIPEGVALHGPTTENSQQLGLTIAAIALLIIAGSISAAMADKKLQGKEHDLQRVNVLLSQLDQARVSLQQVAHYDPLTNLINRRGFNQIFAEKLQEHTYTKGMLAVMFLDIDHFKRINDSLGHDAGDELLKVIAERIRSATRAQDVVARFGGDEFCILLSIPDYEEARHLAHRVMHKMKETIALAGRRMVMTTSIGIAVFPRDGSTCDELLKHADLALYQSKDKGRNGVNFFNPALKTKASLELQLEEELRNALREGKGLQVYYQPIVDMRTGHVAKLEALVRWNHPHHGLLVPARFISIAETNGLIAELDNWVLRRACHDLRTLGQEGLEQLIISVNCSALTLGRNELVEEVERALADADAAPGQLELEVTENALMGNISNTIQMLKHIRSLGVSLSIDDFGTGYSSLAYLKRLPLDTLKIDRSFIIDIPQSPQDMEIVQAILVMAHTLRLKVVTEGVETQDQLEFLRQFGSDYVQGYLFSRPQPLERILPLARQMNQREPTTRWSALPQQHSEESDSETPAIPDVFAELRDNDDFASPRPVRT
ncbi:Diguanylate cye [Pseudomonas syringae pv. atrofaciens]|uniref:cyclic-guanylate-specific phosphodiesterase n=1 Tax=Pseudomonas syringae pv. atrofaciens TaxID=192087 RepID=A0A0P9II46_PSESX|nr:EAL domain-containing protein [Pseudomonas syringae]AVX26717.1 bifunctional diguanylate cyclase/phosphodiesterase [Pseudomonas syringae pv. atrofaciens]ELP97644.1 diguanylate cyclase [Pseudomonas syringae BRIP34876]ELQ01147.1 diguanylate cyclase [Pseudomonas syringae BRIP34881]KPW08778.1 Diguanylate cye [Pseudomonas syringae pv. atrofaciens]RMP65810.1 Diguanylate cye [Pseudomonas syringae pv. atrofaciens]